MNRIQLINELNCSNLSAECTHCGKEFRLSDAVLFDGLSAFTEQAETKRQEMLEELAQTMNQFNKLKFCAGVGAEKKAIEVGMGKIIEKIIPAHKGFKMPIFDCRPLFEPIDLIVFKGLSNMNIESITFLEVKTGGATLNRHEKMVRDAVEERRVFHKVI
jgi:predicted Holliday junction resolvase-like endonuclease